MCMLVGNASLESKKKCVDNMEYGTNVHTREYGDKITKLNDELTELRSRHTRNMTHYSRDNGGLLGNM
jgi:hypothetical protein